MNIDNCKIHNPLLVKSLEFNDKCLHQLDMWSKFRDYMWSRHKMSVMDFVRSFIIERDGIKACYKIEKINDPMAKHIVGVVVDSVPENIRAQVASSVWAAIYCKIGNIYCESYDFIEMNMLFANGYVPSFDGHIWRIHRGKEATWEVIDL